MAARSDPTVVLRSTSLAAQDNKPRRVAKKRISFDPELPADKESLDNDGPFQFKHGKKVVLEPSRSSYLARLRGDKGTIVQTASVQDEELVYTVEVLSSREIVDVPSYWVRAENILFDSNDSDFLPIGNILTSTAQIRVPVFQRRYCWGLLEWQELWDSVLAVIHDCANVKQPWHYQCHTLGRLLFFVQLDGTKVVLDGQQRLTTCTVLMAAVRDRLLALCEAEEAASLTQMLVCNDAEHRFVPSLDDRADYERCMNETVPSGDSPLLCAKRMFSDLASQLNALECRTFSLSLCSRLHAVTLSLRNCENLQSVFENLTLQTRYGPGVRLAPIDLVRNFVFEHFATETAVRAAHEAFWSPIETAAGSPDLLSNWLCEYLSCSSNEELYGMFVDWWSGGDSMGVESDALQRLHELFLAFENRSHEPSRMVELPTILQPTCGQSMNVNLKAVEKGLGGCKLSDAAV